MSTPTAVRLEIPFLGLHYFDEEHEPLFFGREEQLRDLLAKLADSRFVTVIGSSGTGKSSLARAGLVPALRAGFFIAAGHNWRILKIHPGSSPIQNLAQDMEKVFSRTGVEVTLRRGPLGLIEAARQCGLGEHENLLILVDQFEEIFRYQREAKDRQAAAEEASSFVKLLLEATARVEPAIFALITMRSDYLGACAQFRDLPERINTGLYLIPRMRRDQLEDAITGPAAVASARFSPPLVQKLLNDAGEDPDQLPVLQHALLRAWLNWKRENNPSQEIDFPHYEATGGVRDGLDKHAEEIYLKLTNEDRKIAVILFRCLTERDPSNNDIRRPTELGVVAAIVNVRPDDVRRIADAFRGEGVSFLTPTAPANLDENTLIDITHESLIRKWHRLGGTRERKGWVQDEAELREQYRELVRRARRALPTQDVLTGADLDAALEWQAQRLGPEWGQRYENAQDVFGIVSSYIERSEKERQSQKRRRRRNLFLKGVAIMTILLLAAVYKAHDAKLKADQKAKLAERAEAQRDAEKERKVREDTLEERAAFEHTLRDKAEDSAARADKFRILATARQLASQADGVKDRDSRIEVSALLAIESLKRKPLLEGIQALRGPMALLHRPLWTKEAKRPKPAEEEGDDESDLEDGTGSPRLQFSPNGQYVAQLSLDAAVHVFLVSNAHEMSLPPTPGELTSIAWAGDQLYVSTKVESEKKVMALVSAIPLRGKEATKVLQVPCPDDCYLTPDGKYLRVMDDDGTRGQLYPLTGGQPLPLAKAGQILGVGRDARFLLRETERHEGRRSGSLSVFDLQNKVIGEVVIGEVAEDSSPLFDISGDSGYLAFVSQKKFISIYQVRPQFGLAGQIVLPLDPKAIALSPDGQLIAIADDEGGIRVVDWAVQGRRAAWSHSSAVVALAFSPDGKSVASLDVSGELRLTPLQEGPVVTDGSGRTSAAFRDRISLKLDSRPGRILAASFDPSERFLLIRRPPKFNQLFDATRGTEVRLGAGDAAMISISEEGNYAAALSLSGAAQIIDLTTGSATPLEKLGRVGWLSLSPAAKYLAFRQGSSDRAGRVIPTGPVRIADVARGSFIDLPDGTSSPKFSPDGRWLFLSRTKNPRVVLVRCGAWTVVHEWNFDSRLVTPLFSPDGRFMFVRGTGRASDSQRQPARNYAFLDVESAQERELSLPERTEVAVARFSPDGRLLAIATPDRLLRIFELPSGKLLTQISTDFAVTSIVFGRSSHYLGLASGDAAPTIFQLPSGTEVSRAGLDEKERLLAFHFSGDERSLVFVSSPQASGVASAQRPPEAAINRQYLFRADLIREGCARLSHNLTPEEWKSYLPDYPYERTCPDLPVPRRAATPSP